MDEARELPNEASELDYSEEELEDRGYDIPHLIDNTIHFGGSNLSDKEFARLNEALQSEVHSLTSKTIKGEQFEADPKISEYYGLVVCFPDTLPRLLSWTPGDKLATGQPRKEITNAVDGLKRQNINPENIKSHARLNSEKGHFVLCGVQKYLTKEEGTSIATDVVKVLYPEDLMSQETAEAYTSTLLPR